MPLTTLLRPEEETRHHYYRQRLPAAMLADALNGVLSRWVTAGQRLDTALEGAPEQVRAAVARLTPALAGSDDRRPFARPGTCA